MTLRDVDPVPALPAYEPPPVILAPDDEAAASLSQEINARRARIEDPEALRGLRGL